MVKWTHIVLLFKPSLSYYKLILSTVLLKIIIAYAVIAKLATLNVM
jgi:hypothetical protein